MSKRRSGMTDEEAAAWMAEMQREFAALPPRLAPDRYPVLWAAQEICRWICDHYLPDELRRRVPFPSFSICRRRRAGGCWRPGLRREIAIAERFLRGQKLGRFVRLLRHELGHQLQYDVLPGDRGRPHGPEFEHAHRLLGWNPNCREDAPLPTGVFATVPPTADLDRAVAAIRKRLATQLSARQKAVDERVARELAARCGFEVTPDGCRAGEFIAYLGKPRFKPYLHEYHIGTLLGRECGVGRLWLAPRKLVRGKEAKFLAVNGTAQQVADACALFDEVTTEIDMSWACSYSPGDLTEIGMSWACGYSLGDCVEHRLLKGIPARYAACAREVVRRYLYGEVWNPVVPAANLRVDAAEVLASAQTGTKCRPDL